MPLMDFESWKAAHLASKPNTPEAQLRGGYDVYRGKHGFDSSLLGRTGSGTTEQQRTGSMASGSFGDDHPDAGNANTGDPYIDELRSGRVAGAEDWRRFSNAQLLQWKPYYQGGGQFKNQYGDMVGKPIDSGPSTPQGMDGLGQRIQGAPGGAPQAAPGGPAAPGAPAAQTPAQPGLYDPMNPLQNRLIQMAQARGGFFGEMGDQQGASPLSYALQGQGIWTSDPDEQDPATASPAQAIAQASTPGASRLGTGWYREKAAKKAEAAGLRGNPGSYLASPVTSGVAAPSTPAAPSTSPLLGGLMSGYGSGFGPKKPIRSGVMF
jgi:hypothetical protein